MKKKPFFTAQDRFRLAALLIITFSAQALFAQQLHSYVDPLIGSEGEGNVAVGPSRPYGMIKPGPDCNRAANSGYSPDLRIPIYGFSQTHVSGTGGGPKYGNISVMPCIGNNAGIKQESLRDQENAKLGYYSVLLKKFHIKTEITTTARSAFYRFAFGQAGTRAIKIDAGEFLGEKPIPDYREAQQFVGSQIEIISDTEVRGYSKIRGGWNNGAAYTVYFTAVFDRPFKHFYTWKDTAKVNGAKLQVDEGKKTGAMLFFEPSGTDTIKMKIGISFISLLKAKQNIDEEMPHWSFEKTLKQSEDVWDDLLKRVEVDNIALQIIKRCFIQLFIIPC